MFAVEIIKKRLTATMIFHGAFVFGIFLSLLSLSGVCSGGCSAVSDYTLFGVKFAYIGIIYFSLLAGAMIASERIENKSLSLLFDFLVLSGVGAEAYFVIIQKFGVHQWCPICLTICANVLLIAGLRGYLVYKLKKNRPSTTVDADNDGKRKMVSAAMFRIAGIAVVCLLAVSVGFASAVVGVKKAPVALSSQAKRLLSGMAPDTLLNPLEHADIWLGQDVATTDVYFVSDWYCGFCKKVAPGIEKILPDVASKARYTWLDMPVHMASLNVVPVGISLLINSHQDVNKGRSVLNKLTAVKPSVSDEEAVSALQKAGVNFVPAKERDVRRLLAETVNFCKIHDINVTPSVVIINRNTGITKVLRGADEVSGERILAALASVQSQIK